MRDTDDAFYNPFEGAARILNDNMKEVIVLHGRRIYEEHHGVPNRLHGARFNREGDVV